MTNQRIIKTLFLAAFKIIQSGAGFIFGLILSTIIGLDIYGLYFKILKYIQLSTTVSLLGYPTLLARSVNSNERSNIIKTSVGLSILSSFIILSIIIYFDLNLLSSISAIILSYFLLVFNIFYKIYESLELSKMNSWRSSIINISLLHAIIIIIILIYKYNNLSFTFDLLIKYIILITLIFIIYIFLKFYRLSRNHTSRIDFIFFKNSLQIFSSKLNLILINKFDVIMLASFLSNEQIGAYAICSRIPSLAESISNAVRSNTIGVLSRKYNDGKIKEFLKIYFNSWKLSVFMSVVLGLLYIFFFNKLMSFFDFKINLGLSSLVLFVLPNTINLMFGQVGTFLNVTKQEKDIFKASLISFPIALCCITLGAYFESIESFLLGLSAAIFTINIIKLFYVYRSYKSFIKL